MTRMEILEILVFLLTLFTALLQCTCETNASHPEPEPTMTTTILTLTDESGTVRFFVDTRDEFGNLAASEPFASESEAERHLALVG